MLDIFKAVDKAFDAAQVKIIDSITSGDAPEVTPQWVEISNVLS